MGGVREVSPMNYLNWKKNSIPSNPSLIGEILPKSEIKILKMKWFRGVQLLEVFTSGFQCVAKKIEEWLKFCTSYMVYSHLFD
jgi:hypothetical protein